MHSPQGNQQQRRDGSRISLLQPLPTVADPAARPQVAPGQRPAELAHDARNLISALQVFSELLACPGVLAPGCGHYAGDLRRVAASAARLIDALAAPKSPPRLLAPAFTRHRFPAIDDLGEELSALESPLRALAGPEVRLEVECAPCAGRLALNSEDLLRILFNLVANSVEAMAAFPTGRHRRSFLRITAQQGGAASFLAPSAASTLNRNSPTVVLSVRDNGPGIAAADLPRIFDPGFSTRAKAGSAPPEVQDRDDGRERGMGLAIVRQLVEAAGGAIRAVSPRGFGVRFDIELPVLGPAPAPRIDFVTPGPQIHDSNSKQISAQNQKEA